MSAQDSKQTERPRRLWRRAASFVLWYLVPVLLGIAALGYIYGALIWHVNPPVVAVQGTSMLPTLRTGDLVFLSPPDPRTLKKGDIIAVRVPAQDRSTYALPANVVHRIVRVEHSLGQLIFITKGDNNSGNDVFTSTSGDVVGRLRFVVPEAGLFFLFLKSRSGEIFFGAVALIGLLYFVLGMFDERRAHLQDAVNSVQAVLAETQKLEQVVAMSQRSPTDVLALPPPDPVPASDSVHSLEPISLPESVPDSDPVPALDVVHSADQTSPPDPVLALGLGSSPSSGDPSGTHVGSSQIIDGEINHEMKDSEKSGEKKDVKSGKKKGKKGKKNKKKQSE